MDSPQIIHFYPVIPPNFSLLFHLWRVVAGSAFVKAAFTARLPAPPFHLYKPKTRTSCSWYAQVDLTLDDLKEGLVATKNTVEAAMAPIKQELKDLLGCPVFPFQDHRFVDRIIRKRSLKSQMSWGHSRQTHISMFFSGGTHFPKDSVWFATLSFVRESPLSFSMEPLQASSFRPPNHFTKTNPT